MVSIVIGFIGRAMGTDNVIQAATLFIDLHVKVSNKQDDVVAGDSV